MSDRFARTVPAAPDELPALIAAVEGWLAEAGVGPADAARLMIVFDELLSNAARHGATRLSLDASVRDGRLIASLEDDGPAFDPLAVAAPDTSLEIEDRAIGGLGIHIVREMTDDLSYRREGGCNRLIFGKTLQQ